MKLMTKFIFLGFYACFYSRAVYAGMPSINLTDIAQFRLSSLSFFILLYVVASYGVYKLWNLLSKDFKYLPTLPFRKAMLLVFVWGLCFHLVLVMIAGTRELMTPKAWEKAGLTSKLSPDQQQQLFDSRRHKLTLLKQQLWQFAEHHEGLFPARNDTSIEQELWLSADGNQSFQYTEKLSQQSTHLMPLAYEPDSYGQQRMVLLSNGYIELLSINAINTMLAGVD